MTEDEIMRKYFDAHGCPAYESVGVFEACGQRYANDNDLGVRSLPCVRDEHGEIREQTVKALLEKINSELDELKEAVLLSAVLDETSGAVFRYTDDELVAITDTEGQEAIAEEAADTITAITTLLEALGIDADMRDEAQRRVNAKNRERGRL